MEGFSSVLEYTALFSFFLADYTLLIIERSSFIFSLESITSTSSQFSTFQTTAVNRPFCVVLVALFNRTKLIAFF